ncbi:LacI family transcriptional regulator [Salinibacter sp. 10B]|uniref:LacI family DNA-binding transcriptional regulator n=1 Tax=Salinibacter sp. 10B TaxID=1923971 RepID=UPI000CF3682F|nr:LacI family DNA-binding transcriptional regulator [Salinibacter sp. 10B]PQJ33400.1 LacI family transcriptional regulator [Salinibacter sp. 10B]
MKDVTIDDVADHAGVSKSTVSAVINDRDVVKNSTRQRVLDTIEKLDYRPRGSARRGFRAPNGQSLGFVIKEADNPYYSEVLVGIQEVANEQGYLTFVSSSEGDFDTEKQIIDQFSNKDLDGLIITPILNENTDLSHIFELKRNNIPFVLLEGIRGIQANLVDIDNVEASSRAIRHLLDLGHEHIIHLAGPEYSKHSSERVAGIRRAFSRSPLIFDDEIVLPAGDSFEEGYRTALDHFSEDVPTTAVTCYNDLVALGTMKALRELGLSVPDDVSVVGFDDLNMLDYFPIPLTTVRVPKRLMGRKATELLLNQLQGNGTDTCQRISLEAELIERSSTAPPR